jgi:uncharacterized protein (TIRG00374 family)
MKRHLKLGIGLVVSILAIWLAMKDVRPVEVWNALKQANYLGFAGVMLLTIFGFWIRAFRWRWLLSTPRPVPYGTLFSATMIGFMANNLLPLRLGEFVRAWALGRRAKVSKTTVFATVVVERVVDMITLLSIFGLTLLVHPIAESTEAGKLVRAGAGVLVTASVGLTAFVIVLERSPALMARVLGLITRFLPAALGARVHQLLTHFIDGLKVFRDIPRLAWVFLLSFVMFGVFTLCISMSMWALAIDVPWYGGLVMLVITAIGIMVPAAPGYIGTLNLACVAGLALFGVGKEQSVPFSWFYWAAQWIPISLVGLYYLRREGLSLRRLGEMGEETG